MRTKQFNPLLWAGALAISAGLTVSCSAPETNAGHDAANEANGAMDTGHEGHNGTNTATGTVDHSNGGNGSAANMDGSDIAGGTTTTMSPAEERTATSTEMKGLRATLTADLEAVRARLKVGTQPADQRKADQTKAADLAQGLERVDRALAAMDGATDETWATIREQQLKEVAQVRTWLDGYKGESTSMQ
ncbi:MAG: hypothetical protein LKM36_08010 [Flavobacteriales bacterium]|jgi:hypothetical protein|nr:hypothetical protein [Flavobacteriales bacterium]MBP9160383.1 hypothetical protein [Flavobacteriales bacterium]MCI1752795.1 hypothetical protein [Flavobacteriales bacterium]